MPVFIWAGVLAGAAVPVCAAEVSVAEVDAIAWPAIVKFAPKPMLKAYIIKAELSRFAAEEILFIMNTLIHNINLYA